MYASIAALHARLATRVNDIDSIRAGHGQRECTCREGYDRCSGNNPDLCEVSECRCLFQ